MLQPGDSVPHIELRTVDGQSFCYSRIWQRKNLVLVSMPAEPESDAHDVSALLARMPDFRARDAECVVTRDPVPELSAPAVIVADRWGEIAFVATGAGGAALPSADELLEWVEYLENRCPECEGEAK